MESSSLVARVYKIKWSGRIFPLFLLVCGSSGLIEYLTDMVPTMAYRTYRVEISSVILLLFGLYLTAHSFTARVILSYDAIELRSIFGKKHLLFDEIHGWHEVISSNRRGFSSSFSIEPKIKRGSNLYLQGSFNFDEVFYNRLYQLPNLDAEDATNS